MVQVNNGYEHCECPVGSGGSFCKHICAIHYNGFIIKNIPILSTENRITLGNLAVGNNFDSSFMTPMETTDDATTSMVEKSNDLGASTTKNLHTVVTEMPDNFSFSDQNELDVQTNINLEIDQLQVNMNRITSLAQNNGNLMVLKNLRQFNKLLDTINTVSDFTDIF